MTTEITIRATEHPSHHAAVQHLAVSGDDYAVAISDKVLTMSREEARRAEAAGFRFTYLFDRGGQIVTVPV